MEYVEMYAYILDEIFDQIEQFSKISIDYQANENPGNEPSGNSFTILSVNGHKDPKEFYCFLVFLCAGLVQKVRGHLPNLASGDWPVFLDSAIHRFKQLKTIIRCVDSPDNGLVSEADGPPRIWIFKRKRMDLGQGTEDPKLMPEEVLVKTSEYACFWKSSVKDTVKKLEFIHNYYEYIPRQSVVADMAMPAVPASGLVPAPFVFPASGQVPVPAMRAVPASGLVPFPAPEKIKIHRSVAELAACLKVLHKLGVFGDISKTELCRRCSGFFQTEKQGEISPKSLKNHLDSPRPEVLDFLKMECYKMVREIAVAVMIVMNVMSVMVVMNVMVVMDTSGVFDLMDDMAEVMG